MPMIVRIWRIYKPGLKWSEGIAAYIWPVHISTQEEILKATRNFLTEFSTGSSLIALIFCFVMFIIKTFLNL